LKKDSTHWAIRSVASTTLVVGNYRLTTTNGFLANRKLHQKSYCQAEIGALTTLTEPECEVNWTTFVGTGDLA
jgi:hypothetical protein